MLKNYLKTALRILSKNKLYAFINIIGLSVAIANGTVAYLNYQFSQSFDSYHLNKDRIYRLISYKIINNQREDWAITPMPMPQALKDNISGIDAYTRINRGEGIFRYKDKVFNENFHYVDKDFFNIFTFQLKYGSKSNLFNENGIVITSKIAEKYFGKINPVGKQMTLTINNKRIEFLVNGVIKNPPLNSSLYVSILLPFSRYRDFTGLDPSEWKNWSRAAFIMVKKNYPVSVIKNQLKNFINITNKSNINWEVAGFYLESLPEVAFHSRELRSNILMPGLHPAAIIAPSVTALLILLLACFNFLNTSIAFSGKRLNEIAIRKVLGVKKIQLIIQYLGENLILCIIAAFVGIVLAELFVPGYASFWPYLSFPKNFLSDWNVILFLFALLLFITIASGFYPAIYISRVEPAAIFRNKQKLKGDNPLIRILIIFQFTLSITIIIIGLIFYKNAGFIKNYDMGFDSNKIIIIPVKNEKDYELFKSKIEGNPVISKVSSTRHIIGSGTKITEARIGDIKTNLDYLWVGENYLETIGLKIIRGRSFNNNLETDYNNSLIVNQSFINKYGRSSIEGKTIKLNDGDIEKEYHVVGVVKDFSIDGVWDKIQPVILRFSKTSMNQNLVLKFNGSNSKNVYEYLQNEWKKLFSNLPFEGFYQSGISDDAILISESISTIMLYVSILSLIISAMGLFALVSLSIAKRTKEIGIRKILGASVPSIGKLVSEEYLYLFVVASIIAVIAGYYFSKIFISSIYAYYVEFGILPFLLSIIIALFVAISTIGLQLYKAATANPVESLRYE